MYLRLIGLSLALATGAWVPTAYQVVSAPQTPTFRAGTDLVELDVSVLDKHGQPVRGLTQADFTVLENGKPQLIEGFFAVEVPDATRTTKAAAWTREVTPDVTTNAIAPTGRALVVVLDDALMPESPGVVDAARTSAESVVAHMGPNDLAAVHFTADTHGTQSLTNDRATLLAAISTLSSFGNTPIGVWPVNPVNPREWLWPLPPDMRVPYCGDYMRSINALREAVMSLAALPGRRKAVVYISGGMNLNLESQSVWPLEAEPDGGASDATSGGRGGRGAAGDVGTGPGARGAGRGGTATGGATGGADTISKGPRPTNPCGQDLFAAMREAFRVAGEANVAVYTIDPMGLRVDQNSTDVSEFLKTVSNNTGGEAIVDTNDLEPGIAQMFVENSSYYLIGYRPLDGKADGTLRRVQVKVDRPGVEVRTQHDYYARPSAANGGRSPLAAALSGNVPKSDWPMRIALAPFAAGRTSEVTMALGLQRKGQPQRATEHVQVMVQIFTHAGDGGGSAQQTVAVALPAAAAGQDQILYDVLGHMSLAPGRYEVLVSARSTTLDTSGSVYANVDVPDFAKEALSLSGVVVSVTPALTAAPASALKSIVPVVPTTERTFARTDMVSTLMRVYQGGKNPLLPVAVDVSILDTSEKVVLTRHHDLSSEAFGDRRACDVLEQLPLAGLLPGDYLLTFEAVQGKSSAERDVRFTVK